VFGFHDRYKIDFEFEFDVHFLDDFLPIFEGEIEYFGDVEFLEVVLLFEAGGVDGISCHIFDREDVLMLLSFLLLLLFGELLPKFIAFFFGISLVAFLVDDAEDGQVSCSGDIDDILVQLEDEAAIGDDLPSLLEGFIEIGLLLQFYSPVGQSTGVEGGKSILSAVLALVMHHVIIIADWMNIHKSTLTDTAHSCAVLQSN
jgi:hypothetical protein